MRWSVRTDLVSQAESGNDTAAGSRRRAPRSRGTVPVATLAYLRQKPRKTLPYCRRLRRGPIPSRTCGRNPGRPSRTAAGCRWRGQTPTQRGARRPPRSAAVAGLPVPRPRVRKGSGTGPFAPRFAVGVGAPSARNACHSWRRPFQNTAMNLTTPAGTLRWRRAWCIRSSGPSSRVREWRVPMRGVPRLAPPPRGRRARFRPGIGGEEREGIS
jgi:hypothetical protein